MKKSLVVRFTGSPGDKTERKLEALLGKSAGDAGTMLATGERDMTFYYDTELEARRAMAVIRGVPGVTAKVA